MPTGFKGVLQMTTTLANIAQKKQKTKKHQILRKHLRNASPTSVMWLLMVTTKELGTYQPVGVLSMGDGVFGALVRRLGRKEGIPGACRTVVFWEPQGFCHFLPCVTACPMKSPPIQSSLGCCDSHPQLYLFDAVR
jgi:hypothetical protein